MSEKKQLPQRPSPEESDSKEQSLPQRAPSTRRSTSLCTTQFQRMIQQINLSPREFLVFQSALKSKRVKLNTKRSSIRTQIGDTVPESENFHLTIVDGAKSHSTLSFCRGCC